MDIPDSDELQQRVKNALSAGNKIEAIKIYRAQTGLGLSEAKEAVERIEKALRFPPENQISGKASGHERSVEWNPRGSFSGAGPEMKAIREKIFAGQRIAAIKQYREYTRAGLFEAKVAVEKLEAELRLSDPSRFTAGPKRGCLGMAAVIAGIFTAGLWWMVR